MFQPPVKIIKTKDGRSLPMRELTVEDTTGCLPVLLWGDLAYTAGVDSKGTAVIVRNLIPSFDSFSGRMQFNVNNADSFEVMRFIVYSR